MTDREAMQQAQLEKLDGTLWILNQELTRKQAEIDALQKLMQQALEALEADVRERLTQPQRTHWEGCEEVHPECKKTRRREWVGLTDREFQEATDGLEDLEDCWKAIEAKLEEKNK